MSSCGGSHSLQAQAVPHGWHSRSPNGGHFEHRHSFAVVPAASRHRTGVRNRKRIISERFGWQKRKCRDAWNLETSAHRERASRGERGLEISPSEHKALRDPFDPRQMHNEIPILEQTE